MHAYMYIEKKYSEKGGSSQVRKKLGVKCTRKPETVSSMRIGV